jgi:hypothetical protein
MPEVFAAGNFTYYQSCVEWDGTNEEDIAAWIRSLDPSNDLAAEADRWQVASVDSSLLVLVRPKHHPVGYPATVEVPLNFWVTAGVYPTAGDSQSNILIVQTVDPAGKWKTTDPYGRPNTLDDLLP